MLRVSAQSLRAIGSLLLTAVGVPTGVAENVASSLVLSDLKGHDSHGIAQLPGYIGQVKRGVLDPTAVPAVVLDKLAGALVDGHWGFGSVTAAFATQVLIEKTRAQGVAAVGIRNCHHIGRLGQYAEQAAEADIIAMVTLCGGGKGTSTTPYGGMGRTLGTNPFAFGVPAGVHPPIIVDFATTTVAGGKIARAREMGTSIPEGWLLTREGLPTTDPNELARGGMLLPMAGPKGFGLSLVAEALGGALTGATEFADGEQSRNCVFMWGIVIDLFEPADRYRELEDRSIAKVKATPPAPGFSDVLLPGERGRRTEIEREREGIPIPSSTWQRLNRIAEELGAYEQMTRLLRTN